VRRFVLRDGIVTVGRSFLPFFSGPEIPFPGNGDRERHADLWFGRRTGAFFSPPWKSRFPATETVADGDSVRMESLARRKSEHLVLAGPFRRQVGEADNSHAMREPSFDRRLD
jgi:hypothetical protein